MVLNKSAFCWYSVQEAYALGSAKTVKFQGSLSQ